MTLKAEIDAKRIVVVGHSRLGKTALLAAAFDERIAMGFRSRQAAAAPRRVRGAKADKAESRQAHQHELPALVQRPLQGVQRRAERLPFDQHCLVALCAPRPVLFPNAVEDQWANPDGQFEMLKAADPVYRLLERRTGREDRAGPGQAHRQQARLLHPRRQALDDAARTGRSSWISPTSSSANLKP